MDRDFFLLSNVFDGVGEYPQHQKMSYEEDGYDYKASNSVHKLWIDDFLDEEPNFNSILLKQNVILTDKISSAPIPWQVLIVNKKILSILSNFNLPPHKVYSVPVVHNEKLISNYFAIHILSPKEYLDQVNYLDSKFWITSGFENKKIEELKITSSEQLEIEHSKLNNQIQMRKSVRAEYFSMQTSFLERMDLFALPDSAFPVKYFVSSNLKNALENKRCTGIRFIQRSKWQEPFIGKVLWKCLLKLPHEE